mgnify:FL=1
MAKANLPVNFKDDVLASAMGGKRRYNMIQNNDGTVSFEDVTTYTQVGSTFGAAQINATNEAVNNAADASKIIDSLETIKANTQSGYIAGALAVKELSSNLGSNIKYVTSNSSTLVIGAGTTTAEFTIPATGHKKYLIYVSQTRNAYNMTFTVTSGGNNVKSITFLNKSTNQVAAIIEVTNSSSDFSINGTAYNGDDSSSSAQITYVVFAI